MSIYHIPYPPDFEIDHAAAHHEERRRRALQSLDAGDVIATVEETLAAEPDPAKHPLFPLVCFHLDCLTAVDGAAFYDGWKALVWQAIDRCVDELLQRED